MKNTLYSLLALLVSLSSHAFNSKVDYEKSVLRKMTGCFIVDYNYSEVEALQADYKIDSRVYDVNKDKVVKEWIYETPGSTDSSLRLQHILFVSSFSGAVVKESMLKHQAEDWVYMPDSFYDFVSPRNWKKNRSADIQGKWVRKITNLDDGLRYQCLASFKHQGDFSEWECGANYAPIPGRETRDMGRKDYQTLMRSTRIMVYGDSWIERQNNIKTVHMDRANYPLVREEGKNWYIRIPDSECMDARSFASEHQSIWSLTREVWEEVFSQAETFEEIQPQNMPPRFVSMMGLEEKYKNMDLRDTQVRMQARAEIRAMIDLYRK